jgi:peptidoglycan/LPS O-acetylase OafA/YrhL
MAKVHKTNHIFGIDALRLLAALVVVLFHFGTFSAVRPAQFAAEGELAFPFLTGWTQFGWIGVPFFFVLSGFVIAFSAAQDGAGRFLIKRAIRILPVLWICSTIALGVVVTVTGDLQPYLASWARSMILSPLGPHIDGVVWTLVVEMVFYFGTAGIIALSANRGGYLRWMDPVATALILWTGLFVSGVAGVTVFAPDLAEQTDWFGFTVLLLPHGAFFGLGMLICSVTLRGLTRARLGMLGFGTFVCMAQIAQEAGALVAAAPTVVMWLASMVLMGLSIRYRAVALPAPVQHALARMGRISYPLYLGHFTLGMFLVPTAAPYFSSPVALFAAALGFVLFLAWLIADFVERPLQRWARHMIGPRQRLYAAADPAIANRSE